ncbi:MAG: hypothetical protein OHK0013_12410 [Sandaracinaceae bacterium]
MTRATGPLTILAIMVIAGAIGLVWSPRPEPGAPRPPSPTTAAPPSPVVTELDARIEAQTRFAETSRSWVDWDVVASLLMERAAASGSLDDLGRASDALARAFSLADPGAGPHLRSAILAARLHRLDDCEAMLDAFDGYALTTRQDRETARSLRADLAFFRGDYASARRGYESLVEEEPDPTHLFSLARLEWSTGHAERAAERLDQAEALATGDGLQGFLALARAYLARERGQLPEAARAAERALALRPADRGTAMFLAEIRLDQGELAAAWALVSRALAADDPRVHEVAARVARARGDLIALAEHREAATRAYDALFARFPEAIAGHATLHYLRFEDAEYALEMARVDAEARPFGEPRARLALALLRAGRPTEARAEIDAVLTSGWDTAEAHAIAAAIFAANGDARASAEEALAEALAPGAMARIGELARP